MAKPSESDPDAIQRRGEGGRKTVRRERRAKARSAGAGGAALTQEGSGSAGRAALTGRYGMTVKKSVTLRQGVVEEIEARTGSRGFSQFLDAAAERYLALLKAQEIIDDHTTRRGQFSEEELAEAEAAWRGE